LSYNQDYSQQSWVKVQETQEKGAWIRLLRFNVFTKFKDSKQNGVVYSKVIRLNKYNKQQKRQQQQIKRLGIEKTR
jgi:hypothetical protein